ncbi:unnamed protein product [Triticum turgidum subsp. durum]|uniref:Glycosyltransferase n=1 Tax=Triticum turgidum subsp. durum TaxID=4567 RepID=A0A9R0RDE8_TRITD|nr:unnamed protein product [Triticum turgidum subsp. durum]
MDGITANTTTISPRKPRVMLYSSPLMGHLVPMIELAKLFAARGLAITVVLMDPPYDTGATGPFLAGVSAANPSISFHRLPQVKLLESDDSVMPALAFARLSNPHLRDFLAGASPDFLVVDFFCSAAMDVASELNIPAYFFSTSGAQILAFFMHLTVLHGKPRGASGKWAKNSCTSRGSPRFRRHTPFSHSWIVTVRPTRHY